MSNGKLLCPNHQCTDAGVSPESGIAETDHSSASFDSWEVDICELDGGSSDGYPAETSLEEAPDEARKSVRFDTVAISEHAVTLGCHPSCLSGAPVTIEWESQDQRLFDLDQYEKLIEDDQRRRGPQLRMPKEVRADLLAKNNHTRSELIQAQMDAQRIRRGRNASALSRHSGMELAWESASRKFKRWRNRGKALDGAELWLQDYQLQQKRNKSRGSSMKRCMSALDFTHSDSQLVTNQQSETPKPGDDERGYNSLDFEAPSSNGGTIRRIQSAPLF